MTGILPKDGECGVQRFNFLTLSSIDQIEAAGLDLVERLTANQELFGFNAARRLEGSAQSDFKPGTSL